MVELEEGVELVWANGADKYRLKIFKHIWPRDPYREAPHPDVTMLFWGDRARRCEIEGHMSVEDAFRAAVVRYVSNDALINAIASGSSFEHLRLRTVGGLLDIYEDVGQSELVPRYLGLEPDGVVASIKGDLSASQCSSLLAPRAESFCLHIDEAHHGVEAAGPGKWEDADGIVIMSKDAAIKEAGGPAGWRSYARRVMEDLLYRYDAFLQGAVWDFEVYPHGPDLPSRPLLVDRCGYYGRDLIKSGIADAAERGLREALKKGAVTVL